MITNAHWSIHLYKTYRVFFNLNANVVGVQREDKFIILKKKDILIENDKAFILANSSQVERTMDVFGKNEKISDKILIIGAGNIGLDLQNL